jgi:hypothetical protein
MEGLLFTIALVAAIVFAAVRWRRSGTSRPPQSTEPPGERSAPDDWPRDGGDNPPAP